MGYLFAIGIVVLNAVALDHATSSLSYLIAVPIVGYIIFLWGRSRVAELRRTAEREEFRRQRIKDIAQKFSAIEAKFLSDVSGNICCFESEIDAELAATKIGGMYFERRGNYVVINRSVADSDLSICKSFLDEALSDVSNEFDGQIPHLTLKSISESTTALSLRNERIAKLREERNKQKLAILANVELRTKCDFSENPTAVYIFASKVACKVGISDAPEKRLRQIQTGHPSKLRVVRIWWFATVDDAARVEKSAHGLLKVKGAHTSGEWFSAPPDVVLDCVRKVIADLLNTSEIDRSLKALGAITHSDIDVEFGKLASLPWRVSRKGNEWTKFGAHHVVIFKTRNRYSFRFNNDFSKETFESKADAKVAALQAMLQSSK